MIYHKLPYCLQSFSIKVTFTTRWKNCFWYFAFHTFFFYFCSSFVFTSTLLVFQSKQLIYTCIIKVCGKNLFWLGALICFDEVEFICSKIEPTSVAKSTLNRTQWWKWGVGMFVDRIGIIVYSDQWKRGSSFSDQSCKFHVSY